MFSESFHVACSPIQDVPKKVPSIEIRPFVVNLHSYTFGNLFVWNCFVLLSLCYVIWLVGKL